MAERRSSSNTEQNYDDVNEDDTIIDLINGAIETEKQKDGDTFLHKAARSGEVEMVKLLLNTSNINLNQKNEDGDSLLHIAATSGKVEIVKLLLNTSNIDPNQKNKTNGDTPLHIAVREKKPDMVQLLLERGDIDPDTSNKTNGDTPLHIAVRGAHVKMVELILERGNIDPDKVNKEAANMRNMKDLYDTTKTLTGKFRQTGQQDKDKNGKFLTTIEEQIARWVEYFKEHLNRQPPANIPVINKADEELHINLNLPTNVEIKQAVKKVEVRKGSMSGQHSTRSHLGQPRPNS
ncbi:ankyrin-2-like [Mytilus trossulus]|uniref:ankyrin-2-like n=1 Tax=Mytilus trossulus TaxID=6551 RepID=UPI00300628B3